MGYFNQDFEWDICYINKLWYIQKCNAKQKTGIYYDPCHHDWQNVNLFSIKCYKNYVGNTTTDYNLLNYIIIAQRSLM